MIHPPSDGQLPSGAMLADDAIELRLLRVLAAGDAAARLPEARFLAAAPEYRFAIHRRTDGLRVGRIHLRITDDPRRIVETGMRRGPSGSSRLLPGSAESRRSGC